MIDQASRELHFDVMIRGGKWSLALVSKAFTGRPLPSSLPSHFLHSLQNNNTHGFHRDKEEHDQQEDGGEPLLRTTRPLDLDKRLVPRQLPGRLLGYRIHPLQVSSVGPPFTRLL